MQFDHDLDLAQIFQLVTGLDRAQKILDQVNGSFMGAMPAQPGDIIDKRNFPGDQYSHSNSPSGKKPTQKL
jgi:hypothetical protein